MKSRHRPTAKIVILACTALGLVFAASPAAWLQEKKPDKAAGKDSGKKPQKGQEKAAPGKKKKRAEPVNRVNDAYITIKRERKKLVDKYLAELFAIADGCVKKKLPEPARRITDLILKVVEPPKNRKKVVAAASGVGLDAGGERVVEEGGPAVRVVPQKRLTPEEEAELKAARERVAKIREELGIGPDGEIQKRDGAPPETFEPPDPGAGDGGDKSDGGGGENKPKSDPTVVVGKKKEGGGDSKGGAVGKAKPV
ncbi:MAG: hypothetical protein HY721_01545, partial [Planctomycetes bacterium]|nr:hypothetical protein [Planctomycetota bacterium]